jgi:hypothetical protein
MTKNRVVIIFPNSKHTLLQTGVSVKGGAPQASILVPLHFLMYIDTERLSLGH